MTHSWKVVFYVIFISVSNQVFLSCCQLQQEDDQQDIWILDDSSPKLNIPRENIYNSNSNTQDRKKNEVEKGNNYVTHPYDESEMIDHGDVIDFSSDSQIYKRSAQNRREKGKRRRINKHNRPFQGKLTKVQITRGKNKEAREELTKHETQKEKHFKSQKSSYTSNGDSKSYKNLVPETKEEIKQEKDNAVLSVEFKNQFGPSLKLKSPLSSKENVTEVKDEDKTPSQNTDNFNNAPNEHDGGDEKPNTLHSNISKQPYTNEVDESVKEPSTRAKVHKNGKNVKVLQKVNKIEDENGDAYDSSYEEKSNATNTNKLIKTNSHRNKDRELSIGGNTYTNLSMINKGFQNAALKKFSLPTDESKLKSKDIIFSEGLMVGSVNKNESADELGNDKFGSISDYEDNDEVLEEENKDQSDSDYENNKPQSIVENTSIKEGIIKKEFYDINPTREGNSISKSQKTAEISSDKTQSKIHFNRKKRKHHHKEEVETLSQEEEHLLNKQGEKVYLNDIKPGIERANITNENGESKRSVRGIEKRSNWIDRYKPSKYNRPLFFGGSDEKKEDDIEKVGENINDYETDSFAANDTPSLQSQDDNEQYSYRMFDQEESENVGGEDNFDSENRFEEMSSRQEPRLTCNNKESCGESYKAKPPIQPTVATKSTYEKYTTEATCTTTESACPTTAACLTKGNNANLKLRTTPKTNDKSQSAKKMQADSEKTSINYEEIDLYEQYLSGQLANNFVEAVLTKVKKSRKIYSELGFKNDTEETCDRCIETKSNKIPSMETIKSAIGKCSKPSKQSSTNCFTCYSVPKSMEKFLNLLILFEKEHETTAYNKIRDDSSFIFTGDYPDQRTQNGNTMYNNDKYTGDRESFDKDSFEKQHLREENNDEKSDYQISNKNIEQNSKKTALVEDKTPLQSSPKAVESKSDEEEEQSKSEVVSAKETPDKTLNGKGGIKSSVESDEKLQGNNADDEFYSNAPFNNMYSYYKDSDSNSVRRRKAYKTDKFQNTFVSPKQPQVVDDERVASHQSKLRPFNVNPATLMKINHDPENQFERQLQVHSGPSRHEHVRPRYGNRYSLSSQSRLSDKHNKKSKYFNNPYEYPEPGKSNLFENGKNQQAVPEDFLKDDRDNSEYQLISNLPGQNSQSDGMNTALKPAHRKHDYDDKLNIMKRDTEPNYEDELLFFEIPDIEYDLY